MNPTLSLAWSSAWPLLLLMAAVACGAWALRRLGRLRRSRLAKRSLDAERAACKLLRSNGYDVVDTGARQLWPVIHGGRRLDVTLRADILVRRGGRRFVAEVKSTKMVADLRHGPTRRQLLEYAVAYGCDGVLLVDMHGGEVEEVRFPELRATAAGRPVPITAALVTVFTLGACIGLSVMAWWTDQTR